jgi:nitronate monooxygenase
MQIQTAVTRMLGIDLPIIGAPMFLVSYPDLVCAVSNAGGIGTMPALNYRTTDELRAGLTEIRSRTTKPIGINLISAQRAQPQMGRAVSGLP